MDNKNNQPFSETGESRAKKVWKSIGLGALSVALALITVLIINM